VPYYVLRLRALAPEAFSSTPACPGMPREQLTCLRRVERETYTAKSPWMRGPEGRLSKRQPSPEGLGSNSTR
jgi:hypothetical protein